MKKLNYTIQFSNIQVGKISVLLQKGKGKLHFKAESISEGFVDYIYSYRSQIISNTLFKNNEWLPKKYFIKSTFNKKKTSTEVTWDLLSGTIKSKLDPPLDLKKVHKIDKKSLKDVVDPISTIFNIIKKLNKFKSCNNKFKIYDGRRRYNIILKNFGDYFLEKDRVKSFHGATIVCGIKFIPIGGHRLKSKWKPQEDSFEDIKIFFSNLDENAIIPVRVDIKRWFGTVIIRLFSDDF